MEDVGGDRRGWIAVALYYIWDDAWRKVGFWAVDGRGFEKARRVNVVVGRLERIIPVKRA